MSKKLDDKNQEEITDSSVNGLDEKFAKLKEKSDILKGKEEITEKDLKYNKELETLIDNTEKIKNTLTEDVENIGKKIKKIEKEHSKNLHEIRNETKRIGKHTEKSFDELKQRMIFEKPIDDKGKLRDPNDFEQYFITDKKSFATGLNFYKLFWVFFIGCFVGVVVEMLYCLAINGMIESRKGLIYGLFNPVYGFGAVLITVALYYFRKKNSIWIFIGGTVIGGTFEYLASYFQEKVFGTVSWDYSSAPFNINGRICLLYSIFWGILAIFWLKYIYPGMSKLIEMIPNKAGKILTWVLVVFMILNMAISSVAVNRMNKRHNGIAAKNSVEKFIDKHYDDKFMKKIYPNMMDPVTGKVLRDI